MSPSGFSSPDEISDMRTELSQTTWGRIRSYPQLQEQLHRDLLTQHPEWIEANGNCPTCDEYDRRFAELISFFRTHNSHPIQHAA